MNGLTPREAARLQRFIDLLHFPVLDGPEERSETHKGMARALLATKHRWGAADLAFLRWAAMGRAVQDGDYPRLKRLLDQAKERAT